MPCSIRLAHRLLATLLAAGAILSPPAQAADKLPLHERIDRLIEASALGPLAEPASDVQFLRRVSLDLGGSIPTSEQVQAFAADRSPEKRERLVDRLLASPQFIRHMTHVFDAMLIERRADKAVKATAWQDYLYESFAAGKPYNQLIRELLEADGLDAKQHVRAHFLLCRDCEPHLLTRDVGRLLFGMDLQCAQCHDHPIVDDYLQEQYYGLNAFLVRTSLFNDKKTRLAMIAESAEGESSYKSVFTGKSSDRVQPRVPLGPALAVEPALAKTEQYVVPPAKDKCAVPKFSRRRELARLATDGRSVQFNRNAANRLWALVMGRGLVDPVDFDHPDNPPVHPELLTLLAQELRGMNFDVKRFLRELVLTRTCQRSFIAPSPERWLAGSAAKQIAALRADSKRMQERIAQTEASLDAVDRQTVKTRDALAALAKTNDKIIQPVKATKAAAVKSTGADTERQLVARKKLQAKADSLVAGREKLIAQLTAARVAGKALAARLDEAAEIEQFEKSLTSDRPAALRTWDSLVGRWTTRGQIARLKPLSPEQFAMSLLQATGKWSTEAETLRQKFAAKANDRNVEQGTYDNLRSAFTTLASTYADASGEFAATSEQALFFGNGELIDGWIKPAPGNLADQLVKLTDNRVLADELYLSVLSRRPDDDEQTLIVDYLNARTKDRPVAIGEMIWALLSSNEFRFNH